MGPPTDPGPWAVPEFPNGQSTPGYNLYRFVSSVYHLRLVTSLGICNGFTTTSRFF
ncbi:unnamed protein product [Staurois parvus]|uniref:Uncharacterized protein n=1 Tax=Staurois parvus TaxID=386267 RepID=A0ABN9AYN9_9NEOB|nr:unnamed protein product [Staurois parvus]